MFCYAVDLVSKLLTLNELGERLMRYVWMFVILFDNIYCSISTAAKTIDSLSYCDVCDITTAPKFWENYLGSFLIDVTKKRFFFIRCLSFDPKHF